MTDAFFQRQVERLSPGLIGSPEDLSEFLIRFSQDVVRQPTLESVSLSFEKTEGVWTLRGWVCYPAMEEALRGLLTLASFQEFTWDVSVLPSSASRRSVLFNTCASSVTGHSGPEHASPVVHIWNAGDPIRPLHTLDSKTLCQSEAGYLGWVGEADLEIKEHVDREQAEITLNQEERWREASSDYLGAPYVWGGTSPGGVDCSGFVQAVYRRMGVLLPRDSHQQMLAGGILATHDRRAPLAPGDLLFFTHGDGRVGHVAISLGGARAIHAEEPLTTEFSLNPADPDYQPYRERHFVLAKRILNPSLFP
jgi:hypothetical protein